jgi:hypothetical protein
MRGVSRFRVRVQLVSSGPRPYRWEIRDEETDDVVKRSLDRFRTSAAAWQAGTTYLNHAIG